VAYQKRQCGDEGALLTFGVMVLLAHDALPILLARVLTPQACTPHFTINPSKAFGGDLQVA
jgi:hypothetical protein